MAIKGSGTGQGRVRSQLGKGRMVKCSQAGHELCQRAAFFGKGVEGPYHCGSAPLLPKSRVGQQKQTRRR